jgi:hypothetical protein
MNWQIFREIPAPLKRKIVLTLPSWEGEGVGLSLNSGAHTRLANYFVHRETSQAAHTFRRQA